MTDTPKPKKDPEPFSLRLDPEFKKDLNKLKDQISAATIAETIRRAVYFMLREGGK